MLKEGRTKAVNPITQQADVIVVGFGPVGAAVAGLLGRRGLSVTVLERDRDVFPLPRAAHVDHTGLRTWQEIGVLDRLLPDMEPNKGLDFVNGDGQLLARIPSDQGSISGLPSSMYFFQPALDSTIREVVTGLPTVTVELGVVVTGIDDHGDAVTVHATGPDGMPRVHRAGWLIACDGPSSTIRRLLGIKLEDTGFHEPWLVLDLILGEGADRSYDRAICWCDPSRPAYSIPMPFDRHRFEFRLMPGDDHDEIVRPERIQELISAWFPPGTAEVERSAIYTFHGLVAERWRVGRVLLAGDAVHQMPPFLGQGMCSGLRDIENLAWKLDAVIRGTAPEALLDTYELERRDHSRAVVHAAVELGDVICVVDPAAAAARDSEMLGDPRPATERLSFALPDLARGPLVLEGGGQLFIQPRDGMPRFDDVIGQRFAVFSTNADELRTAAADWWRSNGALVADVAELEPEYGDVLARWMQSRKAESVIVRPDRYTMWAGHDLGRATREIVALFEDQTVAT